MSNFRDQTIADLADRVIYQIKNECEHSADARVRESAEVIADDCADALYQIFVSLDIGDYFKLTQLRARLASEAKVNVDPIETTGGLDGQPVDDLHKIYKGRVVAK